MAWRRNLQVSSVGTSAERLGVGADHDGGRAAGAKGAATEETRKGLRLRILPGTGCHRAGPPSKSGARAGGGRSDDFTQSNCGGTEAELATSATTCLHPQPPSRAYICVRNHIAFLRSLPPAKIQVLLMPQRGGPEEVLTEFFGRASAAAVLGARLTWTPGGEWLVTEGRNDERQPSSLFLVSTSTGEKRQLTWPEKTQRDTSPAVSPDGRSLVFARKDAVHRSELYLVPLSGDMTPRGSPIKLPSADLENHHPAWTADGKEIVFAAGKIWNDSLWRMQPLPSGTPRWLGITGGANRQPAISRAGNRLAFTKLRGNQNIWQLNLASGDGGTLTPVPFVRSTHDDSVPDYSPNGERIAFGSNRSGSPEIWLCNADGSQPVPLTSFRGPKVVSPRWSPNGEQIAFSSEADGNLEMYTISVKGRTRKRLTTHPAWDGNAHWSRDGKWIYFVSDRSGTLGAWKMPAEGGDALPLSGPLSNVRYDGTPIESPDGKYLYFLRDDSAWRIPVEGGEAVPIVEELFSRGRLAVFEDGLY